MVISIGIELFVEFLSFEERRFVFSKLIFVMVGVFSRKSLFRLSSYDELSVKE